MGYPILRIIPERKEIIVDRDLLIERDDTYKINPIINSDYTFDLTKGGYLLNPKFDWIIVKNGLEQPMLVPLKKRYNYKI